MNIPPRPLYPRKATVLLVAAIALLGLAESGAQTVFLANNLSGSVAGASTSVAANGPALYNVSGPVVNNLTGLTFGNGFTMSATGPDSGAYNNSFKIAGNISGDAIAAGTLLGISYDFALAKNHLSAFTGTGVVTWTLSFSDSVNTSSQQIATGSFGGLSATFGGTGSNYSFTSGVGAGATFLATLNVSYFGDWPPLGPVVTGTMSDTGFGGGGITLNAAAIPEPSTYAAIVGAGALGLVVWRRRRSPAPVAA